MRESVLSKFRPRPVAFALALVIAGTGGLVSHPSNAVVSTDAGATSRPIAADGVLTGRATVIDGDTLDVTGVRVRLEGIDAPESAQTCPRSWIGSWNCGREAQRGLARMVDRGPVQCIRRGTDKYGRMLGVCRSSDGREINAEMVRAGLAWAFVKYSSSYVDIETEARASGRGIWQSPTEPAWTYREKRWASVGDSAPNGCAIKGNISDKGAIYHMPWSPWYARIRIEPAKGERWFCSEAEAETAGWRPAMVH